MSDCKFHLVNGLRAVLMFALTVGCGLGTAWCNAFAAEWSREPILVLGVPTTAALFFATGCFASAWVSGHGKRHASFELGYDAERCVRRVVAEELKKQAEVAR